MPKRKQRPGAAKKGPPAPEPEPEPELKSKSAQAEPTTGTGTDTEEEQDDHDHKQDKEGEGPAPADTNTQGPSAATRRRKPGGDQHHQPTPPTPSNGTSSATKNKDGNESVGIANGDDDHSDDAAFTPTQLRQLREVVTSALVGRRTSGEGEGGDDNGDGGKCDGAPAIPRAPAPAPPPPPAPPPAPDDDAAELLRRLHGHFAARLIERGVVVGVAVIKGREGDSGPVQPAAAIRGLADELVQVAAPFVVGAGGVVAAAAAAGVVSSSSTAEAAAPSASSAAAPAPAAEASSTSSAVKVKAEGAAGGDGREGEDGDGGEDEDDGDGDDDDDDENALGRGGNKRQRRSLTERWNDRFAELVSYKARHGDCMVPKRDGQLGRWVKKQREHYRLVKDGKTSTLTASRIEQLETLGFRWSIVRRDDWNTRLAELARYRKEKGDCLVPKKYSLNPPLGRWVDRQRNQHKHLLEGKASTLNDERLKQLNALGFCWSVKDARQGHPHDRADREAQVEVEVEVQVVAEGGDAEEGGAGAGAGAAKVAEEMDVEGDATDGDADADGVATAATAGAGERAEEDGGAHPARRRSGGQHFV